MCPGMNDFPVRPMLCAEKSEIARGQSLRVAKKKCMALCSFSFKSSAFGHRIRHFRRYILPEAEVTNVGALKF